MKRSAAWLMVGVAAGLVACHASARPTQTAVTASATPVATMPIEGRMVGPDGVGIAGKRVHLLAFGDRVLAKTKTGPDGAFRFATSHPGLRIVALVEREFAFARVYLSPRDAQVRLVLRNPADQLRVSIAPTASESAVLGRWARRGGAFESRLVKIGFSPTGETLPDDPAAYLAVFDDLAQAVMAEPEGTARSVGALAYYQALFAVQSLRGDEGLVPARRPRIAAALVAALPPDSPLWELPRRPLIAFVAAMLLDADRGARLENEVIEAAAPALAGPVMVARAARRAAGAQPGGRPAIAAALALPKWKDTPFVAQAEAAFEDVQAVGQRAPAFSFDALAAGAPPVDSATFAGTPYLLDIWGTWCKPCVAERRHLREVAKYFGQGTPANLAIVSVVVDPSRAGVDAFLQHTPTPGTLAFVALPGKDYAALVAAFTGDPAQGLTLPITLLVGADGRVLAGTAAMRGGAMHQTIIRQLHLSPLENMIPKVQDGTQTALRSKAHPFAKYITKIHRSIHEAWAWGFLDALDRRGRTHALNDDSLWTRVEIVLDGNGVLDQVTTVHSSGSLAFDVAAREVVGAIGPFPNPPPEILSADGKVYIHWAFHRDERACGTFGAQPFVLGAAGDTKPGPDAEVRPQGKAAVRGGRGRRADHKGAETKEKPP